MIARILQLLLVTAGAAFAQLEEKTPEERKPLSVPEPQRQRSAQDELTITVVDYHDAVKQRDILSLAVPELIRFFKESTDIEVDLIPSKLPLYDDRVLNSLLFYMTGQDAVLRLGEAEKKNLGKYLKAGGLLFAEDIVTDDSRSGPPRGGGVSGTPFDRQFKVLMKDPLVLGGRGSRWQKVPKSHPIYSLYFDFHDGPPLSGTFNGNVFDLEMLEYRGRIAVIFSDLNLSWYWATLDAEGRDRPLQVGVNLIIQALSQRFAGRPLPTRR